MVIKPGGLEKLFGLLKLKYEGSVSVLYHCRACGHGRLPHDPRTMRIFPTLEGDFNFRCHGCGGNYNTLELVRKTLSDSFERAAGLLHDAGVVERPYSQRELTNATYLATLHDYLEIGARRYASKILDGKTTPWFGEWAILTPHEAGMLLPRKLLESGSDDSEYFVRLRRNVFGRPVDFVVGRNGFTPIGSVPLEAKEPVVFSMAPWNRFTELDDVILCSSWPTARQIGLAVAKWPEDRRLPVLFPERMDVHALAYRIPFSSMLHVIRDDENPALALAFWQGMEGRVRTKWIHGAQGEPIGANERLERGALCSRGVQDALAFTVSRITNGGNSNFAHELNTTLSRAFLSDGTKRTLINLCAEEAGMTIGQLLDHADVASNPYAVRAGGKKFVCRKGIYLMQDRKEQWHIVSNFSIRIIRSRVDERGDATHELLLSADGESTTFTVTAALLNNHARLWTEARRAAALAKMPELIMPNGQHRNLLPSLIKQSSGV